MNSELKIYNTLSRSIEKFEPINAPYVGMYVCGPTVSGESHLGHARPYVTFDVIYRYLCYLGYKVRYVRNITDAGHFEEEGRDAIDKVSEKSKLERLEPMELVQKYTNLYHDAMDALGNTRPSIEPTATGHIPEQIEMIQDIISKGYAYESNGSVYFDVRKYAKTNDYGKLSGRILDDMISGTRELDGQEEKRNQEDFALWKKAPEEHIMRWNSPWGIGFPGWHIECSAMATKYLGKHFDIHGGGMDLQFPHHESEIAQSSTSNGCSPAKYWIHNNMITVNGKKMGKSYNNTITLRELFSGNHELLEKAYSPATVRFLILQTQYRSTLDFSNEALQAAEKGLKRLVSAHQTIKTFQPQTKVLEGSDTALVEKTNKLLQELDKYMNDDFNTASVIANLFEVVPTINSIKNKQISEDEIGLKTLLYIKEKMNIYMEEILGFKEDAKQDDRQSEIFGKLMKIILDERNQAKSNKDFDTSDRIRKSLEDVGLIIKDGKEGTDWGLS